MITKHFTNMLAMAAESANSIVGVLPARDVNGKVYYLCGQFTFPGSRTTTPTTTASAAGISIGTGNTAATAMDYNLESTLTSGVNLTLTNTTIGVDTQDGLPYPYVQYNITVTNTGSEAVTIAEIGYKQTFKGTTKPQGDSASDCVCLIDRTVLSSPMTIAAGDAGVIEYVIKTKPQAAKTVSGVDIVSFTYGTDAQVGAMIDAAHNGTIDLQTDGGWQVGDMRTITVGAFTGGVSFAEQTMTIAISSFEDYNSCGCVMQFDFVESLTPGCGMNASNTNVGGYGGSRMYTTTLPAMVSALPSWLSSRLLTFNVLASAGGQSATIETVGNNKLALRSEIEIFGTTSYSAAGEGSQIEYYKTSANRQKQSGYSGAANSWWERSPNASNSYYFCTVNNTGTANALSASSANGVSPFGCI